MTAAHAKMPDDTDDIEDVDVEVATEAQLEVAAIAYSQFMEAIGIDPEASESTMATPMRVAKMYMNELTWGLRFDPETVLKTRFKEKADQVILQKDIPFWSICEHHFVPFFGKAHVAYIPTNGEVVGLSKLARLVRGYAAMPSIQERIGNQVADALEKHLKPKGSACLIEAEHMCMTMRGVKAPGSVTVTSSLRGVFLDSDAARAELFGLVRGFRGGHH